MLKLLSVWIRLITEIKEQLITNYPHIGHRRMEICGRILKSGIVKIIRNYKVHMVF